MGSSVRAMLFVYLLFIFEANGFIRRAFYSSGHGELLKLNNIDEMSGGRLYPTMSVKRKRKPSSSHNTVVPLTPTFFSDSTASLAVSPSSRLLSAEETILSLRGLNASSATHLDGSLLKSVTLYSSQSRDPAWSAECIWLLGKSGILSRPSSVLLLNNMTHPLIQSLYLQRHNVSSIHLSKTFVGLAYTKSPWTSLPTYQLISLLELKVSYFEAQGVANIIWSLGKMNANHNYFPLNLRLSFLQRLRQVSRQLTDQGISNVVYGLAKVDSSWKMLPLNVKSSLSSAICRLCFRMSGQAVGNTLYSLGVLGVYRESLTDRLILAIEISIRRSFEVMKGKDIVQAIHGLSLMRFQWSHLSARTKECISVAVFKQMNRWSEDAPSALREVSLLLYSLSNMNVVWKDLSPGIRSSVLVAIRALGDFERKFHSSAKYGMYGAVRKRSTNKEKKVQRSLDDDPEDQAEIMLSSAQSIATLLYSLAKLKVTLSQLAEGTGQSFSRCLILLAPYLSDQGLAMVFYSFSRIGMRWQDLSSGTRVALEDALLENLMGFDEWSLAQVFYGLGGMKCSWKHSVPEDLQSSLLASLGRLKASKVSSKALAMVLHGLAQMGVNFDRDLSDELQELLLSALRMLSKAPTTSGHDLSICIRSLGGMRCDFARMSHILPNINVLFVQMEPRSQLACLQGVSDMKGEWSALEPSLQNAVLEGVIANSEYFTHEQIAKVVYSLGSLQLPWSSISSTKRARVYNALESLVAGMDTRTIAMTLGGLALLRISWSSLPVSLQSRFVRSLPEGLAIACDGITLTALFSSLGHLHCKDDAIEAPLLLRLRNLYHSLSPQQSYRILSSLQHSYALPEVLAPLLSRLFISKHELAERITVFSATNYVENSCTSRQGAAVFIDRKLSLLARLGLDFKRDLSPTIRESVVQEFNEWISKGPSIKSYNALINLLLHLVTLKVSWRAFSPYTWNYLLQMVMDLRKGIRARESVFGHEPLVLVRQLGGRWNDLHPDISSELLSSLIENAVKYMYDKKEVLSLIADLRITWAQFSSDTARTLVLSVSNGLAYQASMGKDTYSISLARDILLAFGASWESFPTRPRNELSNSLGSIAILCHSDEVLSFLVALNAKWRMLTKSARHAVKESFAREIRGKKGFAVAVNALEIPLSEDFDIWAPNQET